MKYFRVKYGFNVSDSVSIPEDQLEKAIYAKIKKIPVQLGKSFISGTNIISIEPDYHHYTGWYPWYEPTSGDDYLQIERDCPPGIDQAIEHYHTRVKNLINQGQEHLIGKGEKFEALPEAKREKYSNPFKPAFQQTVSPEDFEGSVER